MWLLAWVAVSSYVPPAEHRHEQLSAMRAAFSRFGAAEGGGIDRQDLPDFLRFVVASMNSAAIPPEQVISRSTELTQQLMSHLPPVDAKARLSLEDILRATDKTLAYPIPTTDDDEGGHERGRLGSKQLRTLRKRLERNRLTMPLFDTKGWVRDFEKALKIQCAHGGSSDALERNAHALSFNAFACAQCVRGCATEGGIVAARSTRAWSFDAHRP